MVRRRGVTGGALAALALSSLSASAEAKGLVFEHRFTAEQPGVSTGSSTHIVYPDYDGRKPKPLARLVLQLPDGAQFDESVVPTCTASDQELLSSGTSACPPQTRIGGGTGTAVTGFGSPFDPVPADVHLFHGPNQLMNVATLPGSDRVVVVGRGRIQGNRVVYTPTSDTPPYAPGGPPDGRTSTKEVLLRLDSRSVGGRNFLTTPAACPAGGTWRFTFTVSYEDGSADTATSASPCQSAPGGRVRPRMGLRVRPRRVHAGELVHFRFGVSSLSAACREGARIRFGHARLRTDRRGRAAVARRLRRPGRYRVRATKRRCQTATATVSVIR